MYILKSQCVVCVFRIQLAVCISNIVKYDFPGRWTQIVDKITIYLQNPDASCWPGVLLALHQLVKNFEYVYSPVRLWYSVMQETFIILRHFYPDN